MLTEAGTCPVCQNIDGHGCKTQRFSDGKYKIICDVCGVFAVTPEAFEYFYYNDAKYLSVMQRAVLSYDIRQAIRSDKEILIIKTKAIEDIKNLNRQMLSPSQQATNAIRYIGDVIMATGEPITILPPEFRAEIGSPNEVFSHSIVSQLSEIALVHGIRRAFNTNPYFMQNIDLTLSGWDAYEREKKGKVSGNYGFIALKFGDAVLDPFLENVIKPAVATIGYDLVDLRNVAKAGVIDNVMREQIRDAAFVLVDLTHANNGAYWEAGYAEGLGKPVLYLCEGSTFDEVGTHFDTNHCTTIPWLADQPADFAERLTATLRRSLGLFST